MWAAVDRIYPALRLAARVVERGTQEQLTKLGHDRKRAVVLSRGDRGFALMKGNTRPFRFHVGQHVGTSDDVEVEHGGDKLIAVSRLGQDEIRLPGVVIAQGDGVAAVSHVALGVSGGDLYVPRR